MHSTAFQSRRLLVQALSSLALGSTWVRSALAQEPPPPAVLATEMPAALYAGSARLRFLGWDIYDARLWVSSGFQASTYAQHAFALELLYLRGLSGSAIAQRSMDEMRRVGSIDTQRQAQWLQAMQDSFVDVKSGDRMLGLHGPSTGARFWFNDQQRPAIAQPEFSRYFFGIWLHPNTSQPKLRADLLRFVVP